MSRLFRSITCAAVLLSVVSGCSSDSPSPTESTALATDAIAAAAETTPSETVVSETVLADTDVAETGVAAVAETGVSETIASETTDAATDASTAVESVPVELVGPVTFSMVAAGTGVWPNPVPKATVAIADIDTEKLCALMHDGGAFPSVTGEYYEGKTVRTGEELSFTCKYRRDAPAPVALDEFAPAFAAAADEPSDLPFAEDLASLGRVTFTVVGTLLDTTASDFFDAGASGCSAAGEAVGLPEGWRLETIGSVNDNQQIICRGPVPSPEVVTADPALIAKVVGSAGPPIK